MTSGKRQCARWGARLGVLALALFSLVPIHLAFDLCEWAHEQHPGSDAARYHGAQWHLLARLTGHEDSGTTPDEHGKGHDDCPVCSALGTLVGFSVTASPVLPVAVAVSTSSFVLPADDRPVNILPAVYRSRAPPLA